MGIKLTASAPFSSQEGAARKHGRRASAFHGSGSGSAAGRNFRRNTAMDREAIRDQQLAGLAQALGIGTHLVSYLQARSEQQQQQGPQPGTATTSPQDFFNSPAGTPGLAPRYIFVNGNLVPATQQQQQPFPNRRPTGGLPEY